MHVFGAYLRKCGWHFHLTSTELHVCDYSILHIEIETNAILSPNR